MKTVKDFGKLGITIAENRYSKKESYERLTIVKDDNDDIYMSLKDVDKDAKIDLSNTDYWGKLSGTGLPKNYYVDTEGIYIKRVDGKVYPISHPDLSTQPSILPQRYGNIPIKEVLIAYGREYEIPKEAVVLEASSFNKDTCVPAIVKKVSGIWTISNNENIIPDFTIIRYISSSSHHDKYGYGYDIVNNNGFDYIDFHLPSGNLWSTGLIGEHGYVTEPSQVTYDPSNDNLCSQIPVIMGGDWEAPTAADYQELIDKLSYFNNADVSGFTNDYETLLFCGQVTRYRTADNKQLFFSRSGVTIANISTPIPTMVKAVIHTK